MQRTSPIRIEIEFLNFRPVMILLYRRYVLEDSSEVNHIISTKLDQGKKREKRKKKKEKNESFLHFECLKALTLSKPTDISG